MNWLKKLFGKPAQTQPVQTKPAQTKNNFYDKDYRKQIFQDFDRTMTEAMVRQVAMGIKDDAQVLDLSFNIARDSTQSKYKIPVHILKEIIDSGYKGQF